MTEFILDKMFCVPIDSEDAKCHPDLGDGRKSYKSNGYYVFQRNGQWYFCPERNEFAHYHETLPWGKFKELESIFGDELKPVSELPKEEGAL